MSSSQPQNFLRNVLSNYLNAAVLVAIGFLITPLLTHHLGVTRYGVWALIGSLIPYFELLELGFANSTVVFVAKHLESGDADLVNRTLNTSFFVLMVPGLIAAGLAGVVTIFLPHIVHTIPPHLVGQARVLLLLLAFDMVVSIPMDTFGGALIGFQRYDLLNASLITVTVVQAIGWFIVLELHGGLVALGVVTVAVSLCGQVARFLLARRIVPRLSMSPRGFDRSIFRSFVGLAGWFSLSEISGALVGGVDVIVVGIIVGVRAAGIYAIGQRLGSLPGKVITPPTDAIFPYAGQLASRGDHQAMRNVTEDVTRVIMALAVPTALAVIFLAGPAVQAWVGPAFHQSAEVAMILAGSVIVQALVLTPRTVMAGSGRPRIPTIFSAIEAVLHIALGIVLCHLLGLVGAAYTTLFCAVVLDAVVLLPTLYRQLGMPLQGEIFRLVRAHIVPVAVAGVVAWSLAEWPVRAFVDHHSRPSSIAIVVAAGVAILIPYYAIFIFTGLTKSQRARRLDWIRWGR